MSEFTLAENIESDLDVHRPLERVNYEAGMLLGLEATRTEQAYHRQRVNRLQYWLQGAGTLIGLVVKQISLSDDAEAAASATDDKDKNVRLVVSPGIAIDGLGRELMCYEPYCVNLRDWLESQKKSNESFLHTALNTAQDAIQLMVTIRYHAASAGLQPVMTRKVNAGIDPVQPSRAKDGLILDIIPGAYTKIDLPFVRAGLKMQEINQATTLTDTEKNYLAGFSAKEKLLKDTQAQLLYGLTNEISALELKGSYTELAQVVLATIEIPIRKNLLPSISPIIRPNSIRINNLIRPFLTTNDQLAWLNNQEMPL
jgi:hypothetical protein